jgi:hypothetical protein
VAPPFLIHPSTAFGHSDRKKRASTGRFVTLFVRIQLLSVNSWQLWVTVIAFCDFFRKLFATFLESIL